MSKKFTPKKIEVNHIAYNIAIKQAEAKTYAARRRTLLTKAVDKYKVMAALVRNIYNGKRDI